MPINSLIARGIGPTYSQGEAESRKMQNALAAFRMGQGMLQNQQNAQKLQMEKERLEIDKAEAKRQAESFDLAKVAKVWGDMVEQAPLVSFGSYGEWKSNLEKRGLPKGTLKDPAFFQMTGDPDGALKQYVNENLPRAKFLNDQINQKLKEREVAAKELTAEAAMKKAVSPTPKEWKPELYVDERGENPVYVEPGRGIPPKGYTREDVYAASVRQKQAEENRIKSEERWRQTQENIDRRHRETLGAITSRADTQRESKVNIKLQDELGAVKAAEDLVGSLETLWRGLGIKDRGSAVKIYLAGKTGFNKDAKVYADELEGFLGNLARALGGEKGVLTDNDIRRIRNSLAKIGLNPTDVDDKVEGEKKWTLIREIIENARKRAYDKASNSIKPQEKEQKAEKRGPDLKSLSNDDLLKMLEK